MNDLGIYTVVVEQVGDDPQRIVGRVEETDEGIENLALRLEALVEHGTIEAYTITGVPLAPVTSPTFILRDILEDFWHWPTSREPKDGVDAILYDKDVEGIEQAWERGWRNRDYYFTRNARRNIR